MDLLRLVLCRQPLKKLAEMSKLLNSDAFLRTRSQIWESLEENIADAEIYTQSCVRSGELSFSATKYASPKELEQRALFLRDADTYVDVIGAVETPDIPAALISAVPRIQAAALATVVLNSKRMPDWIPELDPLGEEPLHSLLRIDWTPRLRRAFEEIILPIMKKARMCDNVVLGFLGLAVKGFIGDNPCYAYFAGYAARVLGLKECIVVRPDLKSVFLDIYGHGIWKALCQGDHLNDNLTAYLVGCGYVYPVLKFLEKNTKLDADSIPFSMFITHGRYKLLLEIHDRALHDTLFIPYTSIYRLDEAIEALKDIPEFRLLVDQYRIINGEQIQTTGHEHEEDLNLLMLHVGIPSCIDIGTPDPRYPHPSHSAIHYYDSAAVLDCDVEFGDELLESLQVDAYRLGRCQTWDPSSSLMLGERDFPLDADNYTQILNEKELERVADKLASMKKPKSLSRVEQSYIRISINKWQKYNSKFLSILQEGP